MEHKKTDALRLKENIRLEKKDWEENMRNIPYQVLGNKSKFAYSSSKGHSSFTWAREKINQLGIMNEINVSSSLIDWLIAIPSYYIPNLRRSPHSFFRPSEEESAARVATVTAVSAVALGVAATHRQCIIL